jgi:hypothetical protein
LINLFEVLLICNICISIWVAYSMGKTTKDIEMLYEGLAIAMAEKDDETVH